MSQPPRWPGPEYHQRPPAPYGPDPRYGAGTQPGPFEPPQQPTYSPPPVYQQPLAYPPPGYPLAAYPPPPPPPPKRRTGLKIALGVLACVVVLCGVGGYLVARPFLDEYPATLTAPDAVAGMPKLTDPQFTQLGDTMTTELKTQTHATSAIGAFYATGGDKAHAVMVAGVTKLILNPGTQMNQALDGLEAGGQLTIGNRGDVDPGPMGGTAACGSAEAKGIPIGVCAWADHGALGFVVGFSHTAAETADLMRTIRPQVLHRG